MHRDLLKALLVCALLWGCGAASAAGRRAAALPEDAPVRVRQQAGRCDLGDMAACHRLGIWYQVGGAGEQLRGRGLPLFGHACANRYQPACHMVEDLSREP